VFDKPLNVDTVLVGFAGVQSEALSPRRRPAAAMPAKLASSSNARVRSVMMGGSTRGEATINSQARRPARCVDDRENRTPPNPAAASQRFVKAVPCWRVRDAPRADPGGSFSGHGVLTRLKGAWLQRPGSFADRSGLNGTGINAVRISVEFLEGRWHPSPPLLPHMLAVAFMIGAEIPLPARTSRPTLVMQLSCCRDRGLGSSLGTGKCGCLTLKAR
jgi:hypothetical protein